jgi:hypothetical protein
MNRELQRKPTALRWSSRFSVRRWSSRFSVLSPNVQTPQREHDES